MNNQRYTCVSLVLQVVSRVYLGSRETHVYFTLTSAMLYLTLLQPFYYHIFYPHLLLGRGILETTGFKPGNQQLPINQEVKG